FGLAIVGVIACNVAVPALLGFDPQNPDQYGYLAPAIGLLSILAVLPLVAILGAVDRHSRRIWMARAISATVMCAWIAFVATSGVGRSDLAHFQAVDDIVGDWLSRMPTRARVVSSDLQTNFAAVALEATEATRPDLDLVHRHFLAYPGYREEAVRRHADLSPF